MGGALGRLLELQGGVAGRERGVGHVGTGEASSKPAWLNQACASGPKPATRALLRIKTNICVACCVCWGLVFFWRLKIGASQRPCGDSSPRPPRPTPRCARPGLVLWGLCQVLT